LFAAVAEQLEENRRRQRQGKRGARYLLQGLLVCQGCGYAYYGKPVSLRSAKGKKRSYAYYRCTGTDAYRFGGQRVCHNKQVRTDLLEEAVWADVCALLKDPGRIEAEYERRLHNKDTDKGLKGGRQLEVLIQRRFPQSLSPPRCFEVVLLFLARIRPALRRLRVASPPSFDLRRRPIPLLLSG